MNKESIISRIFDELENEGVISHKKNSEYIKCSKLQQQRGVEFYDFIESNIAPTQTKDKLKQLANDYIDSCHDTYYSEFKTYYHQGFLDGINFASK